MNKLKDVFKKHLSPAMIVALLALSVAIGGSATAAYQLGKNSVGTKQLKNNSVSTKKIKNKSITAAKLKNGAITGAKINKSSLGTVPSATNATTAETAESVNGIIPIPQTRVESTWRHNIQDAEKDAPQNTLVSSGPLTVYAKCFTVTSNGTSKSYANVYVETSKNGIAFATDTEYNSALGNPTYLDTDTIEYKRRIAGSETATAVAGDVEANFFTPEDNSSSAKVFYAIKHGDLPGGNGPYGQNSPTNEGKSTCLFSGTFLQQ